LDGNGNELITHSKEKRDKNRRQRRMRMILGIVAVTFIVGLGFFSTISLIGEQQAQAQKSKTEFALLQPRVEAIQKVKGCPKEVLKEMEIIISKFSSDNFINRVFIDQNMFEEEEALYEKLKKSANNNCE